MHEKWLVYHGHFVIAYYLEGHTKIIVGYAKIRHLSEGL